MDIEIRGEKIRKLDEEELMAVSGGAADPDDDRGRSDDEDLVDIQDVELRNIGLV